MTQRKSIMSVGDLAPLRSFSESTPAVEEVWSFFSSGDLVMANLELPLTTAKAKADKAITLKADPSIAASLSKRGIDVLTFANNHAMDYGSAGLKETLDALEKEGVKAVGGGENLKAALDFEIFSLDDLKIAVMGIASTLPTGYAAAEDRPGIAPVRVRTRFYIDSVTLDEQPGISPWVETSVDEVDLARVCQQVALAKQQADIVIVHTHWGIPNGWVAEFQGPLAAYQKPMGHALIDAGADVILGSHPHIIHGVEKYGSGAIVYSLGNFLFHSMGSQNESDLQITNYPPYRVESLVYGEARNGLIVELCTSGKAISELRFHPIGMNSDGDPEFLPAEDAVRTLTRLQRLSKDLDTEVTFDGKAAVLNLADNK